MIGGSDDIPRVTKVRRQMIHNEAVRNLLASLSHCKS